MKKQLLSMIISFIFIGAAANPGIASAESASHVHDYKLVGSTPATCSEEGLNSYKCDCGDTKTEKIPKLPHVYSSESTIEPTCTTNGAKIKICTVCDNMNIDPIEKLGHSFSEEWTIDKEATCLEEGSKSHHCTRDGCDEKDDVTVIPKLEHTYTSEVTKQPTCAAEGIMTFTCSVCGDTKTEAIPKLEHTFTSNVTKEATCTKAGIVTKTCSVCMETTTEAVQPLGHEFGEYTVTQSPTATKEGVKQRVCSVCGAIERLSIPKLTQEDDTSSGSGSGDSNNGSSSSGGNNGSSTSGGNNGSSSSGGNSGSGSGSGNSGSGSGSGNSGTSSSDGSSGSSLGDGNDSGSSDSDNSGTGSNSDGSGETSENASAIPGENTSDDPVTAGEFVKSNLVVILIAVFAAIAIAVAIILGFPTKKEKSKAANRRLDDTDDKDNDSFDNRK